MQSSPKTLDAFDRPCVRLPLSACTLEGFRAWAVSDAFPEHGRFSFIDEEIVVDMSPEELETHNKVKAAVSAALTDLNLELDLGEFFADRTLVTNIAAGVSTEPDAAFATWAAFETRRVRLVPIKGMPGRFKELQGTPDWIMEIVSSSSFVKDTRMLRLAYHRAGIPEYWLIDARQEPIDFQILKRTRARYVPVPARRGWKVSPVFERAFLLERSRNRLGRWRYQLHVRPL